MTQIVFLGLHIAIKFKHTTKIGSRRFMSSGTWCCITGRVFFGIWSVIVPLSSGSGSRKKCSLLGLLDAEEEGTVILWNVEKYSTRNVASHSRRLESSSIALWGPQILHKTGGVWMSHASRFWKQKFWGKEVYVILMSCGVFGYDFLLNGVLDF